MKIFKSNQIKEIDHYTIDNEPVLSIDLMERAAIKIFEWITKNYNRSVRFIIFVGPGNNGADGLALARLLAGNDFTAEIHYVHFTENTSEDWNTNYNRLSKFNTLKFNKITDGNQFPAICSEDVIVDAIFGTGLNKPVTGLAAEIIKLINLINCDVISIDIPSGLFGEDNTSNIIEHIIRADNTLTFQLPKLSFMFPENSCYTGKMEILSIGLHPVALREMVSPFSFLELKDVAILIKKRNKFDHKGVFGHGLLIAGSYGKMGAAVLSAKASLRSGIGRVTCHLPLKGVDIMQTALPEAMVQIDDSSDFISDITHFKNYDAIGIGPGIGLYPEVQNALFNLLTNSSRPVVIDADAINILGMNEGWLHLLNNNTILTPHPREFERITGVTNNSFERLNRQIEFSLLYKCFVVLKGANTSISTPDGRVIFNSTGNPGMATAGSGDVLTGILLSLLAQGYSSEHAAVIAVYLHGLAGDIAFEKSCYEALIASDIIDNISAAFNVIKGDKNYSEKNKLINTSNKI